MKEIIWIDGKVVGRKKAVISIFDHGLLYGDGLFETMKAYGGRIFLLDRHMKRFFAGSRVLGISIPHTRAFLEKTMVRLAGNFTSSDASVRIAVTRGTGDRGIDPFHCRRPRVFLIIKPLRQHPPSYYRKGARLSVASVRCDETSPLSAVKSMNYLNRILAYIEGKRKGSDDVIMLNTGGFVAEATTSNIFVITNGLVMTPKVGDGLLPGITRHTVLALARKAGFRVAEKRMRLHDIKNADEIFLTNSIIEIRGVTEVDGNVLSDRIGPATTFLHYLYRQAAQEAISD